jgi:hypothetical protein
MPPYRNGGGMDVINLIVCVARNDGFGLHKIIAVGRAFHRRAIVTVNADKILADRKFVEVHVPAFAYANKVFFELFLMLARTFEKAPHRFAAWPTIFNHQIEFSYFPNIRHLHAS